MRTAAISAAPAEEPPPSAGSHTLESVFDAHHALVFRVAYRITGNAADAEDVLQTVFLRLANREAGAPILDNPEGYLRRAAINVSLNLLEQRSRVGVALEDAPEPRAASDQRDLREILRLAIAKLGSRSAEMFILRFIEGNSNAEIAQLMGISTLTVAVTLHRARRQLQNDIRLLGGLR